MSCRVEPFADIVVFSWCRTIGNVVHEGKHTHGGHFASHESPEKLVGDVRSMFGRGGPVYGVVEGANGY